MTHKRYVRLDHRSIYEGSNVTEKFTRAIPEIWKIVRPRRWPLLGCLALIVVNRFCSFAVPVCARYLINNVMYQRQVQKLPMIIAVVAGATLVQGTTTYILDRYLFTTGQRVVTDLRMQVQRHIVRLPISFYDENRTGALVARVMTDVEGVRSIIGAPLLNLVGGILTAIIALVILLRISSVMTLLAFCLVMVFGWFLKNALGVLRPISRERSKINAEVTGRLTESLSGIRVVKGYHAEESEAQVFAAGAKRLFENVTRSIAAQSRMSLYSTVALGVVGALVMYVGARQVLGGHLDVGAYVEFTMLLAFMVAPIALAVSVAGQMGEALTGLDRTAEILRVEKEGCEPARARSVGSIEGEITFSDVTFAYSNGKPVLHGISFESKPGTVTALIGPSGAGKSTVIALLCAFDAPTSGTVYIDGVDLSSVRLSSYRPKLGVVFQETFLFDGTIRENVLFSRPDATDAQVAEACRIAHVDEFAMQFPERYDTVVGERGVKLSGGQRQRISIARAILADPRILILDEATSSLDSESEGFIQSGLSYLMQSRTTFVIAHRLSTIRRADQILVLEGGRIVERGTHDDLYRAQRRYYDLYTRQHQLESNLFLAPGEGEGSA